MSARNSLFLALSIVLVTVLSFGALAHALLPHEHSPNDAVTETMHSAFRHDEFFVFVLPTVLFLTVIIATAPILLRQLSLYALAAQSADSHQRSLRRGTLSYRKFR